MPLQATSGAASQDGFGGNGVPIIPNYIEEVFSTYLYTGTGASLTITNGINLSGEGGLVWQKDRPSAGTGHYLQDTVRGVQKYLLTNTTDAEVTNVNTITAFNSNGYTVGGNGNINGSGEGIVSWTFREQPKFFDVVTYSGNGGANPQNISHNLGSTPGFIIVKRYTADGDNWICYHTSLGNTQGIILSGTGGPITSSLLWNNTSPTSSQFTVGTSAAVNGAGSCVAYLFAHDAGGFGLTGTDNVISCGTFTTDGSSNATVSLGYEPQWLLIKSTTFGGWWITDTMRGMSVASGDNVKALFANSSAAEGNANQARPNATGFTVGPSGNLASSDTFIYVAIRRGPMKVPTSGASVFTPSYGLNAGANGQAWNAGFPVDMYIRANPTAVDFYTSDRLRNPLNYLLIDSTAAESTVAFSDRLDNNIGVFSTNAYDYRTWIGWQFRRASRFFDEVCYTGSGANRTVTHNLQAVPELIICKKRQTGDTSDAWWVYSANVPNPTTNRLILNETFGANINSATLWNSTAPTSSVFSLGTYDGVNETGLTFVSYLFATCAGVSKVGSYTGTATTLQIDCGFTAGARFVLIKRTDSTGDWYVWDSARGIIAGNDPYLLLNSSASEVTNTDYIDTYSAGFEISSTAPAAINASGGSFIFLAIA